MNLDTKTIVMFLWQSILFCATVWIYLKHSTWVNKILKPMIVRAEELAKDGVFDLKDRKTFIMEAIKRLEEDKKIKVPFLLRPVLSFVVDKVAQALPDLKIDQKAFDVLTDLSNEPKDDK